MRIVPERLERLVAMGAPFGTLVETVLVSRVATRAMLRDHLRPDLLADRRASTLVATYVGTVDRYCRDAPFPIVSVQTQTVSSFRSNNSLTTRRYLPSMPA